MPNIFKNPEQRKKWNEYNNNYSKRNYRTFCLKLHRDKDKDIIDYLEHSGENATSILKRLRRKEIEGR